MGYWTSFHLINVKIKKESHPLVLDVLESGGGPDLEPIHYFLQHAVIDSEGCLCFKASKDGNDPYDPFDDGTVIALYGKWYEAEEIASWLKHHSEKDGRIVLHSIEGDGDAWGWEFDGKGRMRELQLCSVGKWI